MTLSTSAGPAPTFAEWLQLKTVASNVGEIIEDAPYCGEIRGLLSPSVQPNEARPCISRLAAAKIAATKVQATPLFGGIAAMPTPLFPALHEEICSLLPSAAELGSSRAERLATLPVLCRALPAYAWLSRSEHYGEVLRMLKGNRLDQAYQGDTAEFQLLAAIAIPFGQYLTTSDLAARLTFPSPEAIRGALEDAKNVRRFLSEYTGLMVANRIDVQLFMGADKLVANLSALEQDYKSKPRSSVNELQQRLLEGLVHQLKEAFGMASVSLLEQLTALAGYTVSQANIGKKVREAFRATEINTPHAQGQPTLPVTARTTAGPFDQLLRLSGH